MIITVLGVPGWTTTSFGRYGINFGSRRGLLHDGVDACWCNPVCFMEVKTVEITLTWS